jgi:hypothetical protein
MRRVGRGRERRSKRETMPHPHNQLHMSPSPTILFFKLPLRLSLLVLCWSPPSQRRARKRMKGWKRNNNIELEK